VVFEMERGQTLYGLVETSVERHADRPVFLSREARTTYAQLGARVAAFAGMLVELGVGRGDRVAIVLDGDVDYLVAFYGTARIGATAIPLCPDTRTDPLVYALGHAAARAVVLDAANLRWLEGQAEALPELRAVIVRGDARLEKAGHLTQVGFDTAGAPPPPAATADDLAAIVYTSGTTGRPKGVMLSHRNLVANIRSIVSYLDLTADDVAGMVLPFYYVYGNSVLHTHVAAGAAIAQLGSMAFVARVVEGLQTFACTGFSGVPATFGRLVAFGSLGKYDLSRLRYVTQAGAAMAPALVERLRVTLPSAKVFVMYGQTEAAARLAYLPPDRLTDKLGSAGKAIPGVTLKICDPSGTELPRGEVGEVVAQGDNIMVGYLNDPEATARALRPEGLRTGDIGSMDEEGYLFLRGRESEMIKSGGHRISPLEIEQAIARTPGVREVAVSGVPDEALGEAIAGYVVVEPGVTVSKRAVLDACFLSLPKFKMPAHLFAVGELPKGQSGKVLRRELKDWFARQTGTRLV
jgi:long-chain acyl-CoA synthetase